VLFLDELAEFRPAVLDMLRQPLEEGRVHLARARAVVEYPARCMVVAATNPCRCAWDGPDGTCVCPGGGKQRVSAPFLDRFDVRVSLPPVGVDDLLDGPVPEDSATVAARVATADGLARERNGGVPNSALVGATLDCIVPLAGPVGTALRRAVGRRLISVRGVDRIRRLARTIADLSGARAVGETEVLAALALRGL
jgi:magnesium chelatase family protein